MLLCDVNILVNAHREDVEEHQFYLRWLEGLINSDENYAVSELVLSGFVRVVTHPRIFSPPTSLADALSFVDAILDRPNCKIVSPGDRHWKIFTNLARSANAKGNLIPDAYHAALAIEAGCEWMTSDKGYSRFPGLRWSIPSEH